jgi:predicted dehydrogenase
MTARWTRAARPIGANDKLNIGMIGVGGQGGGNLQRILGLGENVVAVCEVDSHRLESASKTANGARKYSDYREMLETHKDLDAVVVSTPDHHHAPATIRALRKGLHVYCEKPLTHTVEEARIIAQTAAKMKVATQMGTQNHEHPGYLRLVELLQSGAIGDVKEVHVVTDRPGSFWRQGLPRPTETPAVPAGFDWDSWLGPAANRPYHPSYAPFIWRGWWDFGTGAVGDMAIHLMDVSYWALELRGPVSVSSKGSTPVLPDSGPTWMIATFDFPARGKLAPVKVYWYEGTAQLPSHVAPWLPMNGSLFIGDKRMISIKHDYMPHLIFADTRYDYKAPAPYLPKSPGHHQQWINACKTGSPTGSNFQYAGPFTELVHLGNIAYRVGKPISYDPAKMEIADSPEANALLRKKYRAGWEVTAEV